MASRKRANPRFRIAVIYLSVNIHPLIQISKSIDSLLFDWRIRHVYKRRRNSFVCWEPINRFNQTHVSICPWGPSWSWSYDSWIYNYLCNQCLSPLTLWVRIPFRRGVLDTTLCDKVCQWLAAGWCFFPPPIKLTATI